MCSPPWIFASWSQLSPLGPPPLLIGGLGAEGTEKIFRVFFGRKPDFGRPLQCSPPPCYRGVQIGEGKNLANMVDGCPKLSVRNYNEKYISHRIPFFKHSAPERTSIASGVGFRNRQLMYFNLERDPPCARSRSWGRTSTQCFLTHSS